MGGRGVERLGDSSNGPISPAGWQLMGLERAGKQNSPAPRHPRKRSMLGPRRTSFRIGSKERLTGGVWREMQVYSQVLRKARSGCKVSNGNKGSGGSIRVRGRGVGSGASWPDLRPPTQLQIQKLKTFTF